MTSDDLLGTVKAELSRREPLLYLEHYIITDWLRALVTRCEQAEAERDAFRESQHVFLASLNLAFGYTTGGPTAPCEFMEEVAQVLAERDAAREREEELRVLVQARDAECDAARAEAARLRDLLLDGLSHGIDDYWITTAEGVEWRERVKAALDTTEREGGRGDDSDCV